MSRKKSCYDSPFKVEPARSARSTCKECMQKIAKGALRITVTNVRRGQPISKNYHIECCRVVCRISMDERSEDPNDIDGYPALPDEEKQIVLKYVYNMDVPLQDIKNNIIPKTPMQIFTEQQEAELYEMIEDTEQNKQSVLKDESLQAAKLFAKFGFQMSPKTKQLEKLDDNGKSFVETLDKELHDFIAKNGKIQIKCDCCDGYGFWVNDFGTCPEDCTECQGSGKVAISCFQIHKYNFLC